MATDLVSSHIRQTRSSIAMTVALLSWAMFFATLFLAYALYRMTTPVWPPMGFERPELFWPSVSTFFILLSSSSYEWFRRQGRRPGLVLTILLGVGFTVSQWQVWDQLKDQGLYVQAGVFPSLIYSFTWIHMAHIACGFLGLLALFPLLNSARDVLAKELWIKNIGNFWHFLGIIWLLIFLSLFVF